MIPELFGGRIQFIFIVFNILFGHCFLSLFIHTRQLHTFNTFCYKNSSSLFQLHSATTHLEVPPHFSPDMSNTTVPERCLDNLRSRHNGWLGWSLRTMDAGIICLGLAKTLIPGSRLQVQLRHRGVRGYHCSQEVEQGGKRRHGGGPRHHGWGGVAAVPLAHAVGHLDLEKDHNGAKTKFLSEF